jgi:hypothetical protein
MAASARSASETLYRQLGGRLHEAYHAQAAVPSRQVWIKGRSPRPMVGAQGTAPSHEVQEGWRGLHYVQMKPQQRLNETPTA